MTEARPLGTARGSERHDDLGSMPLYVDIIHRFYNELTEAGAGPNDALAPERLFPFDQIHYHGTDAVRNAADMLRLTADSRVLDVGSGLGGPARYLAHTIGCHVTALDVQEQMNAVASDVTTRCGLAGRVTLVLGDALTQPLPVAGFDAAVSWLAIHQIPRRPALFERLGRVLRPGGQLYIEDLHQRAPFSASDLVEVRDMLYASTMTSADDYERELRAAGFEEVTLTDMSEDWSAFCARRAAAWQAGRERHVRVHGFESYERLNGFFCAVRRLFEHGGLGGIRIVAKT